MNLCLEGYERIGLLSWEM